MIVEFVGTPGAGKTTFMPVVQDHFRNLRFRPYSVVEAARPFAKRTLPGKLVHMLMSGKLQRFLLWQVFYVFSYAYRSRFAKQHPVLMQTVLNFQKRRPISGFDRKHVLHWFLHLTGSYEFLKAYAQPGDMLILDEGFVHRVVQLFASENEQPDFGKVAEYLKLIPKPDLIVFLKASSEVCRQRVFERGLWKRFQVKEIEETNRFIQNAHLIVNFAVEFIQEMGWAVFEVDNDGQGIAASRAALKHSLSDLVVSLPKKVYSKS